MSETYNLIFFPTISSGTEEEVKANLSKTLKVDTSKVEEWFAAGRPTVLMKNVNHDVADRYMEAIINCGANCNIQPSGIASGLSLEPKPQSVDIFSCPSCSFQEELEEGMTYEQCPECGIYLDKWEVKQAADAEKEEIRRRLLRDARIREEGQDDAGRKEDELERLRALERELMIELGIKPPSRFVEFFSRNPVSVSSAFAALLVTASLGLSFFVNRYIDTQEQADLLIAPPSAEVQETAPMLAEVIALKQGGNEPLVSELADVSANLRGHRDQAQNVIKAAEQMMKGVGADAFIQKAKSAGQQKKLTMGGAGQPPQTPVNTDTIGGVKGLPGLEKFEATDLAKLSPEIEQHGENKILSMMSKSLSVSNPDNPSGPNIRVSQLSKLDGSMMIDLLKSVSLDLEWDWYLLNHIQTSLNKGDFSKSVEITSYIKNPLVRIRAITDLMEGMIQDNVNTDLQFNQTKLNSELKKLLDEDLKIAIKLSLAGHLGDRGLVTEPYDSIEIIEKDLAETSDPLTKSIINGRLAVAYLSLADKARAKALFSESIHSAGSISNVAERIKAFTILAQRYYDARNVTLANKILSETQVYAATDLNFSERSKAFAQIASAQLYIGDLSGALISVDNASRGKARDQLLLHLSERLISIDKTYLAQKLLNEIDDQVLFHQLSLRISANLYYDGKRDEALAGIQKSIRSLSGIREDSQRILIKSQYARLFSRLGSRGQSATLFDEALTSLSSTKGRQSDVVRGLLALNQARILRLAEAKGTLENVEAQFVKDSIGNHLSKTERALNTLDVF